MENGNNLKSGSPKHSPGAPPWEGFGLSFLATFVLFFLTPMLLAGWSFSKALELLRRTEFQASKFQTSQEIRAILAGSTEESLAREIFESDSISPRFPVEIQKIGTFPPRDGQDPVLVRLAEILAKKNQPDEKESAFLKDNLGWGLNLSRVRANPRFAFSACFGKKRGWLIWNKKPTSMGGNGGESVTVGLYVFRPLFSRLKWVMENRLGVTRRLGAVIDIRGRKMVRSPGTQTSRILASIGGRLKDQVVDYDWGEAHSHIEVLSGGNAIFLQTGFSSLDPAFWRGIIWKIHFVLIVIFYLFFPSIARRSEGINIRVKLFGMFGLAMALPLSGVYLLALGILADQKEINSNASIKKIREEMMKFDSEYKTEEKKTLDYFNKFLESPVLGSGDFAGLRSVVKDGIRKNRLERVEIRDWKNEERLFIERGEKDPGYNLIAEGMAIRAIEEVVGSQEKKKVRPEKLFTSTVLETPEFAFSEIVRKPLKLHLMRFGNSVFYVFWSSGITSSKPFGYIHIIRNHRQAVVSYLKSGLIRNRSIRFFIRDRLTGRWYPRAPRHPEIESIVQGVIRSGEDQVGRIFFSGESYLLVGISPLNLEKFDLIGIAKEGSRAISGKNSRIAIAAGITLAILVGFLCAALLTKSLLLPINDLNIGIKNLRRRNADYRIPVRGDDELGKMAQAFNHMIETMGELDMAKVVQERLLPSKFPQVPGYRIHMKNQMISAIGGDYCDCIALKSGKIFFLIGDVTGHGVGAALMMAMAKTVVTLHFDEGGREEDLLNRLNGVLYDLKAMGQYMTFLGVVLDPVQHTLAFTFAGHPFPVVYNPATDSVGFIEQKKYPLGIRRKQDFTFLSVDFPPGSAVLLYTDGMPESVDRTGKPFGYAPIKDLTKKGACLGAEALVGLFEKELGAHTAGLPFNDDLTLFAITRDSPRQASVNLSKS